MMKQCAMVWHKLRWENHVTFVYVFLEHSMNTIASEFRFNF